MRASELPVRSPGRQVSLAVLALAIVVVPDRFFSIVTTTTWELTILRLLGLVGVSVLAVLPWATLAEGPVRRRLRRWSLPGVVATAIYLVSTDPLYLVLGFCLLTGAAIDTWATRAYLASESMSDRLGS